MQRPHGRLTKRDLKEDALMVWLYRTWGFVEQNYPRILAGIGAVLVVVLVVAFIRHQGAREAEAAVNALGEVEMALFQGKIDDATAKAEDIVGRYEGKPGAQRALTILGNLYYRAGRFSEARAIYEKYLDTYGVEGPGGFGAWTGIAACMEEEKKFREAAEHYAAYAGKQPASPFAPLALRDAARCYTLAGAFEEARRVLQQIVDRYSKSLIAREAKADLALMGAATH